MNASLYREAMNKKSSEKKKGEPRWERWMLGIGASVLVILAIVAGLQYWLVGKFLPATASDDVVKYGISGDFFGFANALFSALAFAMIIVTLWMQKYELEQQRVELRLTQRIMGLQKEEMRQQNESLRQQRFEHTLFSMLDLHNDIVASIKIGHSEASGRQAFSKAANSLYAIADQANEALPAGRSTKTYERWHEHHEHEFGHYFRTLYNTMLYIDQNGGEQRKVYSRLVRAQLSSGELILLLFNGASKHGKDKFKPLIEKYALLKHLAVIEDLESTRSMYQQTAFGSGAIG